MKVIWATRHRPHPAHGGGAVAEYEVIRAAARHHELVVVSGGLDPGGPAPELDALGVEHVGVAWEPLPHPPNRAALLRHVATGREPLVVFQVQPCAAAVSRAVADLEASRPFDVVSVFPGEVAPVAGTTRAPSALLLPDCYTRQARRELAEATAWRHRVRWGFEARTTERWEREVYPRASALACMSVVDGPVLEELTGRELDLIPLPVGDEWLEPASMARDLDVVFVGALDYRPNIEGLRWLAREIWPRVVAASPSTRLHVVGRNPVPEVREAVAACDGSLHADVPDVRPWYWRARASISPVRLGSGTRNKILHAMACGAPLIATSASIEGIGCTDGRDLLVADEPAAFADAILGTLTDGLAAGARAEHARHVVRRHAGDQVTAAVDRFWERAAAEPRRPGPCGSSS
ncbi:MAG TPA: glycosyltransferase [Acidimicrobiales bacterium]